MAYEWAKPGVKCVCIDDQRRSWSEGAPLWYPAKGSTYTVQEVFVRFDGKVGLILEEQTDPNRFYALCRFRPLVTEKHDVELFRHLLSPSPLERLDLLAERMNELAED